MKCTAIKLSCRQEDARKKQKENSTPIFKGEEGNSYSFPFYRSKTTPKTTTLAVTTLNLPENVQCFNTGSSLDRWSKKRTRLKSAKVSKTPTEFDKDFCYETLETDLSLLLNDPEDVSRSSDGSLDNLPYEVHSDIEKLLQETQRSEENEKNEGRPRKKRKDNKKKKSKTIRFSKPPSPQTEQVIRVDVTSNVSANEDKRRAVEISKLEVDNCGKSEMIDDERMELKRNLNENGAEMCDEEFIVRCRQLALRQRRRRLR